MTIPKILTDVETTGPRSRRHPLPHAPHERDVALRPARQLRGERREGAGGGAEAGWGCEGCEGGVGEAEGEDIVGREFGVGVMEGWGRYWYYGGTGKVLLIWNRSLLDLRIGREGVMVDCY
jgi:hypothetical protein